MNCIDLIEIRNQNPPFMGSGFRPICFKLKDNLYVAGGETIADTNVCSSGSTKTVLHRTNLLCCDRYNLKEKTYHKYVYSLPYYVNDVDKILTDAEETFAIISRMKTGKCLVFTEKDGFEELPNFTFGENDMLYPTRILLRIK